MTRAEHIALHRKGRHLSDETKRKIAETLTGHEVSEETRRKISKTQRGRKVSEETIRKRIETYKKNHPPKPKALKSPEERGKFWITDGVSNRRIAAGETIPEGWRRGRLGFVRKSNPKLGRMSDEHRRKISEARKGMKFGEEHRKHLSESHKKSRN